MHPGTAIRCILRIGLLFVAACGRQQPTDSLIDEALVSQLLAAQTDEARRRVVLQYRGHSSSRAIMKAVLNHAEGFASRGELSKSLAAYNAAEFLANENSNPEMQAKVFLGKANAHSTQGQYSLALDSFRQGLQLAQDSKDERLTAVALKGIGTTFFWQGDYRKAFEYYNKSLEIGERIGDKESIAAASSGLGIIQSWDGEQIRALENYERSLQLYQELNDRLGEARVLNSIGLLHKAEGNYVEALGCYQRSLELFKSIGKKALVARVLTNIGNVHRLQGNLDQALELYKASLKLIDEVGDARYRVFTLNQMGYVHFLQREFPTATALLRESLELGEKLGSKGEVSIILQRLGDIYLAQERYSEAMEFCRKGLRIQEQIGGKEILANLLLSLGKAHFCKGNYSEALRAAKRATAISEKIGLREILWEARTLEGKVCVKLKHYGKAKQAFQQAIDTLERLRSSVAGSERDRSRYFEDKTHPYHAMVDLLVQEGRRRKALTYAEGAKARVLLDILEHGRVRVTKSMSTSEIEKERELNRRLISLSSQLYDSEGLPHSSRVYEHLEKARLEYEAFETALYTSHPDLKIRRSHLDPIHLSDAKLVLDDKAAWLGFTVMENKVYLFTLTAKPNGKGPRLEVFQVPIGEKTLADCITKFRQSLTDKNWNFFEQGRYLYSLLVKPAEKQLRGRDRICISPDGILWELPFQALPLTENQYLMDKFAMSYVPSLAVLREIIWARPSDESATSTPSLLALGNPRIQHRGQGLSMDLPEAEKEVKGLKKLYGESRSAIYIGPAASEWTAKQNLQNYRVIHFATHAYFDNLNPMYSSLLLARDNNAVEEDGRLEARELINLDLKIDTTVLSACETARGQIEPGEGIIGLTWAFFVAGSSAIVVSQWKVNSGSTTDLMHEFHRNMLKPGIPKAQALRMAGLKVRRSALYEHPFYWAPFILVGSS